MYHVFHKHTQSYYTLIHSFKIGNDVDSWYILEDDSIMDDFRGVMRIDRTLNQADAYEYYFENRHYPELVIFLGRFKRRQPMAYLKESLNLFLLLEIECPLLNQLDQDAVLEELLV
jgi:hypothetical protein